MQSITPELNQLWGSSFFSKCSKFHVDFRNKKHNSENALNFGDNYTLIGYVKHSLLLGVDMLSSSLNISETTKKEFLELKFFQIDKKIWQNYCRGDLESVSDDSTCWLSINILIPGLLGI